MWGQAREACKAACTAASSETGNTAYNTSIDNSNTIIPSLHSSLIQRVVNNVAGDIATVLQMMNEMASLVDWRMQALEESALHDFVSAGNNKQFKQMSDQERVAGRREQNRRDRFG